MPAVKRGELTQEQIDEIEALNQEQATNLDAAMNKMRAGVPGAEPARRGRPTNEERLARAQEALGTSPTFGPLPDEKQPRVPASLPPISLTPDVTPKPADDGGVRVRQLRYEIDDDVPIPDKPALNGLSYPWGKLNVGQSFFIPEDGRKNRSKLTSMYAAHKRFKGERRFRAEWQDKDPKRGISGFRVWRVQ